LQTNVPRLNFLDKFSATILPANNCSPSAQVENKRNTVYTENTINKKGTQKSNIGSTSQAVHSKNTYLLGSLNDTHSNINDRDQSIITNSTKSAPVHRSKKKIVPTSDEPAIKSSTFAQVGTKCKAEYTENGINCKINKETTQNSNIVSMSQLVQIILTNLLHSLDATHSSVNICSHSTQKNDTQSFNLLNDIQPPFQAQSRHSSRPQVQTKHTNVSQNFVYFSSVENTFKNNSRQ